jgi:imidazolonepropionase
MSVKLFRHARIFTPIDHGHPLSGKEQGLSQVFDDGALVSRAGAIAAVGDERSVLAGIHPAEIGEELDCRGRCLVPGFVDPHTHLCFTKAREGEFLSRLRGADYLEVLKHGGGILSTMSAVRSASEEELYSATRERAMACLRLGTATVEIKSGYGLTTESELKMLRVIRRIGAETPLSVVPTFLGAHAIPPEYAASPDGYVDLVVREMVPAVSRLNLARFCDVFCERGVFSVEQARRVLEAARNAGLGLKLHADEVHATGGAGLAASLAAVSADHLRAASEPDIRAMAAAGVIGVLLPATSYSLRKPHAPARLMVDLGLPLAAATDCNPGTSFTESMPFVFGLAVLEMGLTMEEALAACTLNAAYAVGLGRGKGSLTTGKSADFLLLDGETPGILAFHAGVSPVASVYVRGNLVWDADAGKERPQM